MTTEQNARDLGPFIAEWQAEVDRVTTNPSVFLASHAVMVKAGQVTENEAKFAAQQLKAPDGWDFEREHDGRVEVWGRDLFEGHFWQVFIRRLKTEA